MKNFWYLVGVIVDEKMVHYLINVECISSPVSSINFLTHSPFNFAVFSFRFHNDNWWNDRCSNKWEVGRYHWS